MGLLISQSPQSQDSENYVKTIYGRVVILGSNVVADIKAYAEDNLSIIPFVESNVQPTAAMALVDSANNIPNLNSNAAPSTVGIIANVQDALKVLRIEILPLTISSATMTDGVVVSTDLWGAAQSGVSTNKNICFVVGCTNLQIDAAVATHKFGILINYVTNKNV